jgi:DNA-binding MarR family transcriptional regulator
MGFADDRGMKFDPIITNPGRLSILTALCQDARKDFVSLRSATRLTDGNLTTHARKLASAGLVTIEKTSRDGAEAGRPITYITLTDEGREALQLHVDTLTSSLTRPVLQMNTVPQESAQDNWID